MTRRLIAISVVTEKRSAVVYTEWTLGTTSQLEVAIAAVERPALPAAMAGVLLFGVGIATAPTAVAIAGTVLAVATAQKFLFLRVGNFLSQLRQNAEKSIFGQFEAFSN